VFFPAVVAVCLVAMVYDQGEAQINFPAQGQRFPALLIGGVTVACTSGGLPVLWVANYQLNDVGFTRASDLLFSGAAPLEIEYNPRALLTHSRNIALFWLGHECGHASNQTSDESVADCWSAQTGVRQGWFRPTDFEQLRQEMRTNPGDMTHEPGQQRTARILACMEQATNGPPVVDPPADARPEFEADPAASECTDTSGRAVNFSKTPNDPTVEYAVKYKSRCDKPVICLIRIGVGTAPKTSDDYDDWQPTEQKFTEPILSIVTTDGSLPFADFYPL